MIDNVVEFSGKKSNLSVWVENMIAFFEPIDIPEVIMDLLRSFSTDQNRLIVDDKISENLNYGYTKIDDNQIGEKISNINIDTIIRPRVIPQFGSQTHLTFFSLSIMKLKEEVIHDVIANINSFPNDFYQQLEEYYNSYPDYKVSNATSICFTIVKHILLDNRYRFIGLLDGNINPIYKDKFGFQVIHQSNESVWFYQFEFDFLPILLDNCALKFWEEKLKC